MLNWTIEERFSALADSQTIYRIFSTIGGSGYQCTFAIPSPAGAMITYAIGNGSFETLEEATQACEDHYTNERQSIPTTTEPTMTTEELVAKYG